MKNQKKDTWAVRFKMEACKLMPQMDQLQDLDDTIDQPEHINDLMFRKGEYIGGMAAVILAVLLRK